MATFKDMLKYLRNREGLSQAELAQKIGLGTSTISMYEVGKREPDFETLETIADFFNVDMNFLLGKTGSENRISLTPRDERDIEKILDSTREQLLTQEGLMFEGDPATPEAIDSILSAMQIGMEMAKKKNKEKYTPKKYRKA
jgi:transcriptional regulator with XRE-family HTH domain